MRSSPVYQTEILEHKAADPCSYRLRSTNSKKKSKFGLLFAVEIILAGMEGFEPLCKFLAEVDVQ